MKKTLVVIAGRKTAGKSTVANAIEDTFYTFNFEDGDEIQRYSFADALREVAWAIMPRATRDWVYDKSPQAKLEFCGWHWEELNSEIVKGRNGPMTIRDLLQVLGTDVFRTHFSQNVWVEIIKKAIESRPDNVLHIIDDCRFPNELSINPRCVEKVWRVKIERPSLGENKDLHPSETALDNVSDWDYKIINDGSLEDLYVKTRQFMELVMRA